MKCSSEIQMWFIVTCVCLLTVVAHEYDDEDDYDEDSLSRSIRLYEDRPCQYRRREGVCKRKSHCRRPTRHTCRHGFDPIVCCLDRVTISTTVKPTTKKPNVQPQSDNIDITFPGCGFRNPKVSENSNSGSSSSRSFSGRRGGWLFNRRNKRQTHYHARNKRQFGFAARPVIVGGRESVANSWPWMVAIFRKTSTGNNSFLCGASLISRKYVLTAAHCFDSERGHIDASKYVVMVGSHKMSDGTEYEVDNIMIHPEYRKKQYYNDLTLLRVKNPVALNKKVYPVCLPSDGLKNKINIKSNNVTVTGWGDIKFGGTSSKELHEVSLPIVPLKECNASYSKIRLTNFPKGITNEFICAGFKEGGKDACQGDSGGPMINELNDGAWVQLGVVSFGYGCAQAGFPGVYTRLSHYTKWLHVNTDLGRK